jgi:peptidoglycan/LPS O-acetylase OafA/YrhL
MGAPMITHRRRRLRAAASSHSNKRMYLMVLTNYEARARETDISKRNGFTSLRLCAACFVLVTHSYILLGRGDEEPLARLTRFVPLSALGVDVFFAISGYLLCRSLLRRPSPRAYLTNRCLRILPALALLVAVTTLIIGPLLSIAPDYWTSGQTYRYLLGALVYPWQGFLPGVFTGNPITVVNGSLWTLPLEFTCYLVLLAVSWCGALNWRAMALLTAGLLALHLNDSFVPQQSLGGMELLHLNRLGAIFCGGALLATLGERMVFSRAAAAVAVLLILVALWWGQIHWHRFAAVYIMLLPYVVVTAARSLRRFHWLNRWDISYGIYLYAFVVQQCIIQVIGPGISIGSFVGLSMAGTALCAILSWLLVEQPALSLKGQRWQSQHRLRTDVVSKVV